MSEELPTRWEVELEFVQALANIQYLNFLAQNKYLENEEFLNYLKYLEYWRQPEYAKHLVYPNCLHVLTLLQSEQFRQQILRQDAAAVLMNDMVHRWKEPQTTFAATPIQNLVQQNGHADSTAESSESQPPPLPPQPEHNDESDATGPLSAGTSVGQVTERHLNGNSNGDVSSIPTASSTAP